MRLLSPEAEVTRSLSNLYKPWFVHTEVSKARVINSDAIMAECMEKKAVRIPETAPKMEEGFTEGLFADDKSNVIKVEPEIDYVALAKEEAESILQEARATADRMVGQAQEEADAICEAARNKGYESGKAALEQELEELRGQLENTYQEKRRDLDAEYVEKRAGMEKELIDVILTVFNKVFHIQFDNKKDILMYLIDDAIMNIEGEKRFRVKVAAGNVLFLENHKEEILDRVGHDVELEILADSTMDGNECIIETDSGVFDCSLGTQLENLIKDIRSLCS